MAVSSLLAPAAPPASSHILPEADCEGVLAEEGYWVRSWVSVLLTVHSPPTWRQAKSSSSK